jgi:Zn-dependent protease with chaperone function
VLAAVVVNYLILAACLQPFLKPPPNGSHRYGFVFMFFEVLGEALIDPFQFLKWLWDARLAGWITLGTLLSVALGCFYKIRLLSAGGPAVAEMLGGRCIEPATAEPDERKLRNVVEEMAIASGMPVPDIYVLDNERGINSFAAGHTRDDVAVGVTRGCLKLLTRDELQGVIAHEFSHILNGDTQLNMRLIGLAHGLFWPTLLGRILLRGTSEPLENDDSLFDEEGRPAFLPTAPIGILFIVIGSVSLPLVRLLKSAICRQREWQADAAAVQFTRNPPGITGALKKIGGLYKRGRLDAPHAEVASHLYFANSAFDSWFGFLSTHPPLAKRILAIYPMFDGRFPRVNMLVPSQAERERLFDDGLARALVLERRHPELLVTNMDNLTRAHLQQAQAIRLGFSRDLTAATHDPSEAMAVIYALLLSSDAATRAEQNQILAQQVNPELCQAVARHLPEIQSLNDRCKLPLIDLALPALRWLQLEQFRKFTAVVQQLVECDRAIDLFEYTLQRILFRHLRPCFESVPQRREQSFISVKSLLPECVTLLSALACVGQEEPADRETAFQRGVSYLDAPGENPALLPRDACNLPQVDAVLDRLAAASPGVKRNILMACAQTVAADNQVTAREAELLRAIADSLDCPVPPFVQAMATDPLPVGN